MKIKYITLGPHCWGSSKRLHNSLICCIEECSAEYRVDPIVFNIYKVSLATIVTELGGFSFPANDVAPKKVETRKIPMKILMDYWKALLELEDSSARKDGLETIVEYHV